jgi:hypothetical protein
VAERGPGLKRYERSSKLRVVASSVIALTMAIWVGGPANGLAQASIAYRVIANVRSLPMCTGERTEIRSSIERVVTRAGQPIEAPVSGGRIFAHIDEPSVVHFDPADAGRDVTGQPFPEARFDLVADRPGRANINLFIGTTGEEATLGADWPFAEHNISVEVNDCYEAHTSALAQIFNDKDMGGLNKPFLLAGYTPNTHGLTTDTQVMFFIPNPQNRLVGGFAWVDLVTAYMGQLQGDCVSYFSGHYDVVFYIPPNEPAPPGADVGDLQMFGQGDVFCGGRFLFHLNYQQSAGFLISFKPKPRP